MQEAKKIGHRRKYDLGQTVKSDFSHKLLGKYHTTSIQAKNAYNQSKLSILITELKNKLLALFSTYFHRNQISVEDFDRGAKNLLKQGHEQAYLLGMKASGYEGDILPDSDKNWLDKNRYDEYKYFAKFLEDVESGKGVLDYSKRILLYAEAIRGTYNAGRNAYMPTNMLVYWRLESGINPNTGLKVKHCDSCLALSEMSPFTTENLPIVPRSNHTLCMNGCRCKLVYVSSDQDTVRKINQRLGTSVSILSKLKQKGVIL